MKILFWNTHGNEKINEYVVSLVNDYDVDVLVLAEYSGNRSELELLLSVKEIVSCSTIGCDRIAIWSTYVNISQGYQDPYYSIQIINGEYVVCCAHLPSDLHGDCSEERFEIIQQMMLEIQNAEEQMQTQKTIIVGDLNEMPYSRGCLNANALHGLPTLSENESPTRQVNKKAYRKFYNPMWNLFGDFNYPPGTYYWKNSKLNSAMWYILDQMIFSQEVLPNFKRESLEIVTVCSYGNLANKNGRPNVKISDHFPIICEIQD